MFFIPGWVISLATCPGVILHEISHRLFCDITKTSVFDAVYFRLGNPAGYVIHENTDSLKKSFLISTGPLFINTLTCAILCLPVALAFIYLEAESNNLLLYILAWIGFSCGMHAFPSNQDMENLMQHLKKSNKGSLFFIAVPFAWFFKAANFLKVVWFDLIYAVLVSVAVPYLMLRIVNV